MCYLDICDILDIEKKENAYFGKITPKIYYKWSNFDPITLFLEGVNQFCVKTVNKFFESVVVDKRFVPCQYKNCNFYKELTYEIYFVIATFQKVSDMYIATFDVFESKDFGCQNLSANGQIYLSKIEVHDGLFHKQ